MQLSHYHKVFRYQEKPDHILLFSTKQTSKILVAKQTFQAIEKGMLSAADAVLLSELGMIVADRNEEKRSVRNLFDKNNARNPGVTLTVVLNLDCNFDCVYCFEGEMKGKFYMSDQTAEGLIDFVKKRFNHNKNTLVIDFYGGEPLLSLELIKSISAHLKSFTAGQGGTYGFNLVTNGSLLKRRVAEELVPLGLQGVKITLDGPAENHNQYRPFKSGAGSFYTIIENIKETWDLVNIGIGGNYDKYNYEKFVLLLDYLEKDGLTPDKISVLKFDPIVNLPKGSTTLPDYQDGCMSIYEPWLAGAQSLLRNEILKRGYNTPMIRPMSCMIECSDAFVVNVDGTIYKCPAFVGQEGFALGDLETGTTDHSTSYNLGIWKNKDCFDCEYLPLCFGGCRYMSFVRNGKIDEPDCKKAYFDSTLETLIKQEVKYQKVSGNG